MAKKTFLVSTTRQMAEVLVEAIHEYDTDSGFKVTGTQLTDLKQMTVVTVHLVDGTKFNLMVEMVK